MSNPFFDHPILNSPYDYPRRHWELDDAGQPTQQIVENRRGAKFITPIPKSKKRKAAAQTGFAHTRPGRANHLTTPLDGRFLRIVVVVVGQLEMLV